ncbi:hypothetical protein NKG94_37120 [Micromonospora sp. M12]
MTVPQRDAAPIAINVSANWDDGMRYPGVQLSGVSYADVSSAASGRLSRRPSSPRRWVSGSPDRAATTPSGTALHLRPGVRPQGRHVHRPDQEAVTEEPGHGQDDLPQPVHHDDGHPVPPRVGTRRRGPDRVEHACRPAVHGHRVLQHRRRHRLDVHVCRGRQPHHAGVELHVGADVRPDLERGTLRAHRCPGADPVAPGYAGRDGDTISVASLPLFGDANGRPRPATTGRRGSGCCATAGDRHLGQPWADFTVPAGKATYRLEATATRGAPDTLSTAVSVAWTFTSAHTTSPQRLPSRRPGRRPYSTTPTRPGRAGSPRSRWCWTGRQARRRHPTGRSACPRRSTTAGRGSRCRCSRTSPWSVIHDGPESSRCD